MPHPPLFATVAPTVFFIMWFGYALLMVVHPRFIWRARDRWRATATPAPEYFWTMRRWGVLCAAAGIGLLVFVHAR